MRNNFFPEKKCLVFDNVGKYFKTGQAADESTMHPRCLLGN
jgi:hypothetical protein